MSVVASRTCESDSHLGTTNINKRKKMKKINPKHGSISAIHRRTGHSRDYVRRCLDAYGNAKDMKEIRKMAIELGGSYVG